MRVPRRSARRTRRSPPTTRRDRDNDGEADLKPRPIVDQKHTAEHKRERTTGCGETDAWRDDLGDEERQRQKQEQPADERHRQDGEAEEAEQHEGQTQRSADAQTGRGQLVHEAEAADRQQQEGDVRIGEELLDPPQGSISWVSTEAPSVCSTTSRSDGPTLRPAPVDLLEDVVDGRCDEIDGAEVERFRQRWPTRPYAPCR